MDAAWDAVRLARLPRVHIFIATSQIHMEYKLKMTPDQVLPSQGAPSDSSLSAALVIDHENCQALQFSRSGTWQGVPRLEPLACSAR